MTDREADILAKLQKGLVSADGITLEPGGVNYASPPWLKPREVGGTDASHHSTTLRRMAAPAKGWVEVSRAGLANAYRITDKGAQALANHKATRGLRT